MPLPLRRNVASGAALPLGRLLADLGQPCFILLLLGATAAEARTPEVIAWGGETGQLTDQEVLRLAGHKPGDRVEVTDLDDIFRDAVAGDNAKKFQKLIKTLKDTLDDIRVYRVGEVEKDVYIVGKTKGGGWAGLKSKVVET